MLRSRRPFLPFLHAALLLSIPTVHAQTVRTLQDPGPGRAGIEEAWFFTDGPSKDLGSSVAGAGDVNGDGYDDLLVGAQADSTLVGNGGKAMVFHGSATGYSTTPDWVTYGDQPVTYYGARVASAGDVNADGYDDVLVTTYYYNGPGGSQAGRVWLYLGSAEGLSTTPDWFADGENDLAFFGEAIASAGDVNGDGYDDVLIGSGSYQTTVGKAGRVYLYFGSATGLASTADWMATGFTTGWWTSSLGKSVTGAGDVNGDGYDDIVVGSGISSLFAFLGGPSGPGPNPDWNYGKVGFSHAVSGVGDVNGDGYDDVAAGSWRYTNPDQSEGAVVVFLGSPTGLEPTYSWLAESDVPSAYFGYSVGGGDLNADGYADVLVGAIFYSNVEPMEGLCRVFYGSADGPAAVASWDHEPNLPSARFGISVAGVGDGNGDGYDDLLVGANTYPNPDGSTGRVTVFQGGPPSNAFSQVSGRQSAP